MGYYRVEPLRELENMARRISKFVDEFPDSFSFEVGTAFQPRIDIIHDQESVKIYAELPGVAKEDISLVYENATLILKGKKEKPAAGEKETLFRAERNYGQFHRAISLPFEIQPSSINAHFENGVLIVSMAKSKPAPPDEVKIDIK